MRANTDCAVSSSLETHKGFNGTDAFTRHIIRIQLRCAKPHAHQQHGFLEKPTKRELNIDFENLAKKLQKAYIIAVMTWRC